MEGGTLHPSAEGELAGNGFVVDHILKGESIEEVLSRANNQVEHFSFSSSS